MPSESPPRGRSRTRSHTPTSIARASSPSRSHTSAKPQSRSRSRSPRRSISPRSRSASRSRSRTPRPRNGNRTRSASRSRSPAGAARSYRDRSYTRSPSRPISRRGIQSSKIVVEKLTKNITEGHLREIFGTYGRIESFDMPMNRQFNTNRGTAYILYADPSASENAIAHMHEAQLDGAVINVAIVLPRRAFSRSPPAAKDRRANPSPNAMRSYPPHNAEAQHAIAAPARRGGGSFGDSRRGGPENSNSYVPDAPSRYLGLDPGPRPEGVVVATETEAENGRTPTRDHDHAPPTTKTREHRGEGVHRADAGVLATVRIAATVAAGAGVGPGRGAEIGGEEGEEVEEAGRKSVC